MNTLLAWIGKTDINVAKGTEEGPGALGRAIKERPFEKLYLLNNYHADDATQVETFLQGLRSEPLIITIETLSLRSPTNFSDVWDAASNLIEKLKGQGELNNVTVHLSPGTNTMSTIWLLLASSHNLKAIKTSIEAGLEDEVLPIEIYTNYVGNLVRSSSEALNKALSSEVRDQSSFSDLVYQSVQMQGAVDRAKVLAPYNISVLIEGETGTGKELFATAIRQSSPRSDKAFRVINCGAIPETLIDSELFGYVKGAFTDARKDTPGEFEKADGGTIFLDEVGELPPQAQVRLLRVLQEKKVRRIGSTEESGEKDVDVRIISATNKDLRREVEAGNFREDLYYRLAATTVTIPPLRVRRGDLQLLTNFFIEQKSDEIKREGIKITADGRKALDDHHWPGNVRELELTIARAIIFSATGKLDRESIEDAIGIDARRAQQGVSKSIEFPEGFNLNDEIDRYKLQLMDAAMIEAGNSKIVATTLLGMSSDSNFGQQYKKLKKKLTII